MAFYSPLRYPGGKGKLSGYIQKLVELNGISDGTYIEPYAGGAGVALSLLFNEYMSNIIINDLNKSIYAFWYSTLYHTEELCRLIYDTPVTLEEWFIQKAVQESENQTILQLGFSTFFLNRTNRSGILRGGIIGGKEQTGNWKLDARFNKKDLILRIEKIGGYKDRIGLYNLDASELINSILPALPKRALVYLDPPYFNKGPELYQNNYGKSDHGNLAELITTGIKQNWIVSYDHTPEIISLYKLYRQITYSLNYSAADRYRGSEVMIFSESLRIPEMESQAKVGNTIL